MISLAASLVDSSAHLIGVAFGPVPSLSLRSAPIDSWSWPFGSSSLSALVCGSWMSTAVFIIGAATMKMISSTSMTSTIGVTLISLLRSSPPPVFIAMPTTSPQEVALDDVEVVLLERLHLGAEHADPAHEEVVGHDRGYGGDQAHRRREQRLGDPRADRLQRGLALLRGDLLEREHDADDGAEQPDERCGRTGGREERRHRFEPGLLGGLRLAQRAFDVGEVAFLVAAQLGVVGQLGELGVAGEEHLRQR